MAKNSKKDSEEKQNVNVRIPPELLATLNHFCEMTRRSRPEVIRAAVDLLLADGDDVAEFRLMRNLWDLSPEEIRAIAEGLRAGAAAPPKAGRKRKANS